MTINGNNIATDENYIRIDFSARSDTNIIRPRDCKIRINGKDLTSKLSNFKIECKNAEDPISWNIGFNS